MNALPHFRADVDGVGIHVHPRARPRVRRRCRSSSRTAGPARSSRCSRSSRSWPIPAAHGGDPADAFDVVVPSVPRLRVLRPADDARDDPEPRGRAVGAS